MNQNLLHNLPPKERAPTENNENPIAVTTEAATTGVIHFFQYLASNPNVPSRISTLPLGFLTK